jgi:hypothetical protein
MKTAAIRLAAIAAVTMLPDGAVAQDSLRALLIEYRCPVVDRLERIHAAGDPASQQDRFIAMTVAEHPHGYVQCIFFAHRTKLLCEASSGYYYEEPGRPPRFRLSPPALAALARLGFDMDDSQGNFQMELEVGAEPDFNRIADLILRALHDGYGARAETKLRFNAPFARRAASSCIPVS